jgi:CRISPR/Cas system-associated endoribonuclease Cas2
MNTRHLFLVGYDIRENPIRRRALRDVQTLLAQMRQRIHNDTDRVVFIRLDGRSQSLQLGQAEPIASADYFHIA